MSEPLSELPLTDAVLSTLVAIGLPEPKPGSPLFRAAWPEPSSAQLALGRLFLTGCGMLETDEASPTEAGERLWLALETLCDPVEQLLLVESKPGVGTSRTLLAVADGVIAPLHLLPQGATVGAALSRDELIPLVTKAWSADPVDRALLQLPREALELVTRLWAVVGHDVKGSVELASFEGDVAQVIEELAPLLEVVGLVNVKDGHLKLQQEFKRPLLSLWRGPRLELRALPNAGEPSSADPGPHFIVVGEEGRRYLVLTPHSTGGVLVADESVAFVPLTTEVLREQLSGVLP
ncbi:MAG: hypothetical protein Q8S33_02305 [Myxococcales bacterium]|nr:hypothetical protein [Myxococcales bacterium]